MTVHVVYVVQSYAGAAGASSMSVSQHMQQQARAHVRAAAKSSPHPDQILTYGEAKQIVSDRFQRGIISDKDQEIARLQGLVNMLQGNHQQGSREYNALVTKSRTAFAMGRGIASMDRRAKQLRTKTGQLNGLIEQMQSIRRQLADTRLICELLDHQSKKDHGGRERVFLKGVADVDRRRAELIAKNSARREREMRRQLERDEEERELMGAELQAATAFMDGKGYFDDEAVEDNDMEEDEEAKYHERHYHREHPEEADEEEENPFA